MSSDAVGSMPDLFGEAPSILVFVLISVLTVLLCGVFTMIRAAMKEISEKKLSKMAGDGNKNAARLLKYSEKYRLISTSMHFMSYLCLICNVIFATVYILSVSADMGQAWLFAALYAFLFTCVFLIFSSGVFGRIGETRPEEVAAKTFKFAIVCYWITCVFAFVIRKISGVFGKAFDIVPEEEEEEVSEEEIRQMVEEGEEMGIIPETESEMINNIFEFNDIPVGKIMTHRTDIVAAEKDATFDEVLKLATEEGYTRIPVYEETIDNIVGILHIKTLFKHMGENAGGDFNVAEYMTEPSYVPESKTANELFDEMQISKMHIAVVVDEYGGTAGIVTMEDLIESILGNIEDEYDEEEEDEITDVEDGCYVAEGSMGFDEMCEYIGLELDEETEFEFDFDTVGGFVTGMLDRIPQRGDSFEFENVTFEVLEADDKKIDKVKITVSVASEEEN